MTQLIITAIVSFALGYLFKNCKGQKTESKKFKTSASLPPNKDRNTPPS